MKKLLIIGGVAGGAGAAAKARRVSEDWEIVMFERGGYVSFANCGLPYYIGQVIPKRSSLLLFSPEQFKSRFNVDVRLNTEILALDRAAKTVTAQGPDGGTYTESYDKLVIATGGKPVTLPVPGADKEGVYHVFTVPDADAIASRLEAGTKSVVVVGGGFIGLESAENLAARGVKVTLLEKLPQVMSNMDPEFSEVIVKELEALGICVRTGVGLKAVTGEKGVSGVELDTGESIPCDMVVMAAGVRGSTELAEKAGLRIGETKGIWVDAGMRTSDPDIYAAGDIVESVHLVSGKKVRIPLAGSANKQGRIAGANAVGGNMLFKGVLGTAILKVGGLTAARTGLNTAEAEALGLDFVSVYVPGNSHATYYPGSKTIIMKYTVQRQTGRLLGAQAIGREGVDKRIDVLSTALYANMTVFDLENLDLAYAPPFSSAKDAVIVGGMIAANYIRGEMDYASHLKLPEYLADPDTVVLDCRTQMEWNMGHVEGAMLLPVDELRDRYAELDKSKTYVIYCGVGYRAYNACRFLMSKGYRVKNLGGGWKLINMHKGL
jgi:NADPH-dependent 2,4-dienoyl-CoA reductase/sulfur reductase-like enzyme/rhodanese-related sulfurtransferase